MCGEVLYPMLCDMMQSAKVESAHRVAAVLDSFFIVFGSASSSSGFFQVFHGAASLDLVWPSTSKGGIHANLPVIETGVVLRLLAG